jgi:hypothetical protein
MACRCKRPCQGTGAWTPVAAEGIYRMRLPQGAAWVEVAAVPWWEALLGTGLIAVLAVAGLRAMRR